MLEAMIHFAALQKHNIVTQLYSNKIFFKKEYILSPFTPLIA